MLTIVIIHKVPRTIGNSWYRGQPYIYVKITPTELSSALRNVVEIEQVLTQQYRGKENIPPILRIYTDGGPEHRTNFMSVKLAIIALHQSINADLTIVLRTVPGHSFRNLQKGLTAF